MENRMYAGSTLLKPIADHLGRSLDEFNYMTCLMLVIILGIPFRLLFTPERVGPTCRHVIQISVGLAITFFCYGPHAWHVIIQVSICVAIMKYTRPGTRMGHIVLAVAMIYQSYFHLYRMIVDYGGYVLDVTGVLMYTTQRVSGLAYSMADGKTRNLKRLNDKRRRQAVHQFPGIIPALSYTFSFQNVMIGPFCYFNDYDDFIHGRRRPPPGIITPLLLKRTGTGLVCLALSTYLTPRFVVTDLLVPRGLINIWFIYVYQLVVRIRYYPIFKLAEAGCISAGCLWQDEPNKDDVKSGKIPPLKVLDHMRIDMVELSLNLKDLLNNWNIGTVDWLIHVTRGRVKYGGLVLTFSLSALWHGFYPGYPICFASGVLFIGTGRLFRRYIRPLTLSRPLYKLFYDILTFTATRVTASVATLAFTFLAFEPTHRVYSDIYYSVHILCIFSAASIGIVRRVYGLYKAHQARKQEEYLILEATEDFLASDDEASRSPFNSPPSSPPPTRSSSSTGPSTYQTSKQLKSE